MADSSPPGPVVPLVPAAELAPTLPTPSLDTVVNDTRCTSDTDNDGIDASVPSTSSHPTPSSRPSRQKRALLWHADYEMS